MSDKKKTSGNLPKIIEDMYLLNQNKLPNNCGNCAKEFKDLDHFLVETTPLPKAASLLNEAGHEQLPLFDLWRSCTCGSTLLMICPERRQRNKTGKHQRQAYDKLAERLDEVGFTIQEARDYLKQIFHL